MTAQPSTEWREKMTDGEAERYAGYAREFAAMQRKHSLKYGNGRALHRKQILAMPGRVEVLADLPEFAAHGLFARPGQYEALVRLSNGGPENVSDRKPDARGFAFKVLGVEGPGALGNETQSQDFALIHLEAFAFATSEEFVGLVMAKASGGGALLGHLLKRYGWGGSFRLLKRLAKVMGKPFRGFAVEAFYSAAPIACGPYAAKLRLLPKQAPAAERANADDLGLDTLAWLDRGPLHYDIQLQFFVNEQQTPIEDASVPWPEEVAPYTTVGRLTLPARWEWAASAEALSKQAESAVLDPWCALTEHRPLGDIMRARKVIYYESQKGRGALG
jgi:hypothetical protein